MTSLLLALIAPVDDGVLLTFRANRGDEMTYASSLTFRDSGSSVTIRAELTQQVAATKDGIITLTNVLRGSSMAVDGKEVELPDAATSKTFLKPSGEIVGLEQAKADRNNVRAAMATAVVVPDRAIKSGETWTVEMAADAKRATRKATATYRLTQIEGSGGKQVAVIEVSYRELEGKDPVQTTGTVSLLPTSGWVKTSNLTIKNFPLPGGRVVEAQFSRTAKP